MKQHTIMISLDTSTSRTGVAVWDNAVLKESFCLTSSKNSVSKTHDMVLYLISLVKNYKPDIIVCEDINVVNNIATAKKLATLIGALDGICAYSGIFFDKLSPSEWRSYISLDSDTKPPKKRNDAKKWDIIQVERLFNLRVNDDEADAILVGEAYRRFMNEKGE